MKNVFLASPLILCLGTSLASAPGTTQWSSLASVAFSAAANWTNGVPNATLEAFYVDSSTVQHTINLAGTIATSIGMNFGFSAVGSGFTLSDGGDNTVLYQLRGGLTANGVI